MSETSEHGEVERDHTHERTYDRVLVHAAHEEVSRLIGRDVWLRFILPPFHKKYHILVCHI
jgi:hypothetical protein